MSSIILLAETGSDITAELAAKHNVRLVPMHVALGEVTLDDGTFPPEDVCAYYDRTGKVPSTSASTPYDFETVLDEIFSQDPDAKVLYLAYSAVTTCSYRNCEMAVEDKPYVGNIRLVDTQHVSVGQGAVVLATAQWLQEHPEASLEEAEAAARTIALNTRMCFLPKNLDYLRAGGRCSNAVALVGNLLNLHPNIEIIEGKLIAGKKYRGAMTKIAPQLLREFTAKHQLDKELLYFIHTPYMQEELRGILDAEATALGFQQVIWMKTGCVITCHGGAGAFGIVGSCK